MNEKTNRPSAAGVAWCFRRQVGKSFTGAGRCFDRQVGKSFAGWEVLPPSVRSWECWRGKLHPIVKKKGTQHKVEDSIRMSKPHGEDDGPPDYGDNEQESQEIEGDAPNTQLNIQTDAIIVHRAETKVGEEQPIADDFELEEEEFFGEPEVEKQNTREPEVCS
ncbi:hypothetical protein CsatB_010004 [Cannabis sativa]